MRALGRLLRLSLAPSAAADVAAGIVVGGAGAWPSGAAPWMLIASSLGIYHGALALNDWADRSADARTRPDRPIPSGAIPARAALALACAAIGAGCALAFAIDARLGVWMAVVAAMAVGYDLAGRGPLRGPLLLGLCRAGNLGAGIATPALLRGGWPEPVLLLPALLYGGYVFFVSAMARLEDDEDPRPLGTRPRNGLRAAVLCLALAPLSVPSGGKLAPLLLAYLVVFAGGRELARLAWARGEWSRALVGRATGMALRRLLVFTSALALAVWGAGPGRPEPDALVVALAILAGYPVAHALRRVFPPT